jgi:hypothetical protein
VASPFGLTAPLTVAELSLNVVTGPVTTVGADAPAAAPESHRAAIAAARTLPAFMPDGTGTRGA